MPNWTSNRIRTEDGEADLRAFLESVKWQDQLFDFNRLIPMPDILKHTGTGRRVIDGKMRLAELSCHNIEDHLPCTPIDHHKETHNV
jgi:hypothetical protein